eukprot:TRINITY_DN2200_c0_g1_i2.p1 TRINITY_DN2200_c0_g1~~TRINITY_DN2200_c0_g1_i2.p1  ORF type:complete len:134 (+),score=18.98 TRINITY_DN2200_c0_g1_i2:272-673(+)
MLARGALMKPWIFSEIGQKRDIDMSATDRMKMLNRFASYGLETWGSDSMGIETTRTYLLEFLSFHTRYVPHGLLESGHTLRMNQRPPPYTGRCDMETLLGSPAASDWVKISEHILGKVPENYVFTPKHKSSAY